MAEGVDALHLKHDVWRKKARDEFSQWAQNLANQSAAALRHKNEAKKWKGEADKWKGEVDKWKSEADKWKGEVDKWKTKCGNLEKKLKETEQRLAETEERLGETEQRLGETEERLGETEEQLKQSVELQNTLYADIESITGLCTFSVGSECSLENTDSLETDQSQSPRRLKNQRCPDTPETVTPDAENMVDTKPTFETRILALKDEFDTRLSNLKQEMVLESKVASVVKIQKVARGYIQRCALIARLKTKYKKQRGRLPSGPKTCNIPWLIHMVKLNEARGYR